MQVLDLDPHAVRGLTGDHGALRSSLAGTEEELAGVGEERPERRAVEDDVRGRAADSGRWRRSPPERGGGRPAKGGEGMAAVVRRRRWERRSGAGRCGRRSGDGLVGARLGPPGPAAGKWARATWRSLIGRRRWRDSSDGGADVSGGGGAIF